MDISAAVSNLSVSLTNTCRGLIKLNLALFSSNSLTQNQFKKGRIHFVRSAFFVVGLKAFKYRTFTSESWWGQEGVRFTENSHYFFNGNLLITKKEQQILKADVRN